MVSLNNRAITIELAEARFILGIILSDDLPVLAQELIASGADSKSLIQLGSLPRNECSGAKELFVKALTELGRGKMSKESALREFTKDISSRILCGSVSPFEGAYLIWRTYLGAGVTQTHEYDTFIYAASELPDRPREKKRFEKAIRAEAKRWVFR